MRVASYNHMFGCNGRSLPEFLYVHALHKAKRYDGVERRADLSRTAHTVEVANADVIAITEVLGEKQRLKLIEVLKPQGYQSFHVGRGHGLGQKYGGSVETLLATRMPSDSVYTPNFCVPDQLGYGGGIVGIHLPAYHLYVVQVHLPLCKGRTEDSFREQVQSVLDEVKKLRDESNDSKIVIMGDFNCSHTDLVQLYPDFSEFQKLSSDMATCSTTNLLRWFYRKDLDHVLGIGLEVERAGVLEGISDHKLVWVDLKEESLG